MPSVFISYRHESDAHRDKVRSLAERLQSSGIEVIFDGFEEAKNLGMAPPNGWPLWSINQASHADHVVIVGSTGWFRIFEKTITPATAGLGAAAEAECIATRMYKAAGNTFAVMTYFDLAADLASLPPFFEKCTRLDAARSEHLEKIVNWVRGIAPLPVITPPAPAVRWPAAVCIPPEALADRTGPCSLFCSMLTGAAAESVACVVAASGKGKSCLLDVFQARAEAALGPGRLVYVRNPQERTIITLVEEMCSKLGGYGLFPHYKVSIEADKSEKAQQIAFLDDLRARVQPALIVLDAWEKASEEMRQWVSGQLVPVVVQGPGLKLIIAGQPAAAFPPEQPGTIARLELDDIKRDDWHQFIDRRYPAEAAALKQMIDLCLDKAHGVKAIANILAIWEKGDLAA